MVKLASSPEQSKTALEGISGGGGESVRLVVLPVDFFRCLVDSRVTGRKYDFIMHHGQHRPLPCVMWSYAFAAQMSAVL